jgi:hypothetical protein
MLNPNTEDLLEWLETHQPLTHPLSEAELLPHYEYYVLAPCWTLAQAACLLSGLPPIDGETVSSLVLLGSGNSSSPISNTASEALFKPRKGIPAGRQPGAYTSYHNYVAGEFPLPWSKAVELANTLKALERGLADGEIELEGTGQPPCIAVDDAIYFGDREGWDKPAEMRDAGWRRNQITYRRVPPGPFPDAISFGGDYWEHIIRRNRSKPVSAASLGGPSNWNPPVKPDEARDSGSGTIPSTQETAQESTPARTAKAVDSRDTSKDGRQPPSPEPSPIAQESKEKLECERGRVLGLCAERRFKAGAEWTKHAPFLAKASKISDEELEGKFLTRGPLAPSLRIHRCRAIAAFHRHLDPKVCLKDLYGHQDMTEFGFGSNKPAPGLKTFYDWMNDEGLEGRKHPPSSVRNG